MQYSKDDSKVLKGIALCLMLCHHLFAYPERIACQFVSVFSYGGLQLATWIGQFGLICVATFMFLGGYGIYASSVGYDDLSGFVWRRVLSLYQKVWLVFLFALPFSIHFSSFPRMLLIRECIYNFLGLSCTMNEEWWFILPYVVLLCLFPAIKAFLNRNNASPFTDILLLLLYTVVVNYIIPQLYTTTLMKPFFQSVFWHRAKEVLDKFPAFFLGCFFAKYGLLDSVKARFAGKPLCCVLSLITLAALFCIRMYNYMYYDFINAAVFVCCIVVLLPLKILSFPCKVLRMLAEESTFIWLTHTFFCYYWCQKLVYAPKYSILIFLWLTALSFAAAKLLRFIYGKAEKLLKA